jgi:hypothetical protein
MPGQAQECRAVDLYAPDPLREVSESTVLLLVSDEN